jgi:anti-sigma factor RsiW
MLGKQGNLKRCEDMEANLIEYLDGRAKPALRHGVEKHLAVCAACHARAEEFRAISGILGDLPEIAPSPAFDVVLRARIAAKPMRRNFWNWMPSPRLVFGTAALIALSVWTASVSRVTTIPAEMASQSAPSAPAEIAKAIPVPAETDFRMIRDLPVLENYDVLSNFDALSELPTSPLSRGRQGGTERR